MSQGSSGAQDLAELVRRSAEANAALMRGDARGYLLRVRPAEDFTLMSPFGGAPTHGFDQSEERLDALSRFFRNGTFDQELVHAYAGGTLAVLVTIERQNVEVGGLPAQDWALRVTQVFRREGAGWLLVHRHADPLVRGVTVEQAAALARG